MSHLVAENIEEDVNDSDEEDSDVNFEDIEHRAVSVVAEVARIKGLVTIILQESACYEEFISTTERDTSTNIDLQWLENIWKTLAKNNDLAYENNTRGVPQKLVFILRECMLMHRWYEVGQVVSVCNRETTCDLQYSVWRTGLELLYSDPFVTNTSIVSRMVKLLNMFPGPQITYTCVQLEHLLYHLGRSDADQAIQVFQSASIPNKVKYLPKWLQHTSTVSEIYSNALYHAYQGLAWYTKWLNTKKSRDHYDAGSAEFQGINLDPALASYVKKMKDCFSSDEVKANIVVKDVFIKAETQVLEATNELETAEELLQDYCCCQSDNPNSHKFYYEFLCRNNASKNKKVEVLKNVVRYVPSDPLVLTLCEMIPDNQSGVLKYLFDLLDYDCWRGEIVPWSLLTNTLETLITQTQNIQDVTHLIQSLWSYRKAWWPHYHFTVLSIPDVIEVGQTNVITLKAIAAIFLMDNKLETYVTEVEKIIDHNGKQKILFAQTILYNKGVYTK